MDYRKNAPLIAAIAIPILMIIFVAVAIYVPGLFKHPTYSFLYAEGYTGGVYEVKNGTIAKVIYDEKTQNYYKNREDVKLYLYDVAKDQAREISFEDATKLSLDTNRIALDGFTIEQGRHTRMFDSNDRRNLFAINGSVSKELNVEIRNYSFTFLGWIK
ncbi:MAG: hypothetical protein WCT36_01350 [Candidatus Gracilibacteria bacterium]|jgi:hypothetical protein